MFAYKRDVDDLLAIAGELVDKKHPHQLNRARKCRAVSTLYYALFSELCGSNADALVVPGLRKAWGEVYRALEHGNAKKACKNIENMQAFPKAVRQFSELFERLQNHRYLADYDPIINFGRGEVQNLHLQTKQAIAKFRRVSKKDKCAFATWVLMHSKGSRAIRSGYKKKSN